MNEVKIGIEIECVLNGIIHHIEQGDYHDGLPVDGLERWKAEHDGSLSTKNDFGRWGECIEIISPIFQSKEEFQEELKKFYEKFSKNNQFELNEVLRFNNTCGSHVHFSIKDFSFDKKVIFAIYPKVRRYFKKKLLNSNIKGKYSIWSHYGRSYAKIIDENNFKEQRHQEFNFESEKDGRGLEWRSPNLLKIRTWKDFFAFWDIVYESLEYLYEIAQNYEETKDIELLNKEDFENIEREIHAQNEENFIPLKAKKRKKSYSKLNVKLNNLEGEEIECVI